MPSYAKLRPANERASAAARGASKKRDTSCELVLRRHLFAAGLRYRLAHDDLPGRPDIVLATARVVVFVDGDFWHGRDLRKRLRKLQNGHNAPYWVAKIRGNVQRDRRVNRALAALGWKVLRYWESDIRQDAEVVAAEIVAVVQSRQSSNFSTRRVKRSPKKRAS